MRNDVKHLLGTRGIIAGPGGTALSQALPRSPGHRALAEHQSARSALLRRAPEGLVQVVSVSTGPWFRISFLHNVDHRNDCSPRRAKLEACNDIDEIEMLVRKMGRRWMGFNEESHVRAKPGQGEVGDDALDAMDGLAILG